MASHSVTNDHVAVWLETTILTNLAVRGDAGVQA